MSPPPQIILREVFPITIWDFWGNFFSNIGNVSVSPTSTNKESYIYTVGFSTVWFLQYYGFAPPCGVRYFIGVKDETK